MSASDNREKDEQEDISYYSDFSPFIPVQFSFLFFLNLHSFKFFLASLLMSLLSLYIDMIYSNSFTPFPSPYDIQSIFMYPMLCLCSASSSMKLIL